MNKFLPILALLLATPIFAAEKISQIQVIARYEGLDPAYGYVENLESGSKPQTDLTMPRATTLSDRRFVVRMANDLRVPSRPENVSKEIGMTLDITPTIEGRTIKASGKSSICALAFPLGNTPPQTVGFKILETYFNQTFPNNKEVAIKLADDIPGTLYLTFTLLNREGLPVE